MASVGEAKSGRGGGGGHGAAWPSWALALTAVAVVAAIAVAVGGGENVEEHRVHVSEVDSILEMRIREGDLDDFATVVSRRGLPVVVRRPNNALVSRWAAPHKWASGGLARILREQDDNASASASGSDAGGGEGPRLRQVKVGNSPLFTLENPEKPLSSVDGVTLRNLGSQAMLEEEGANYRLVTMRSDAFFAAAEGEENGEDGKSEEKTDTFVYYSGKLEWWGGGVSGDVEPHAPLELRLVRYLTDSGRESTESLSEVMVWTGGEGVTANAHYDRSHNMFVQVVGRKAWTLFPPTQWRSLYLFPALHPSYHQSQVGYLDVDSPLATTSPALHPQFKDNRAITVTLDPGDMLYIPPYWVHEVRSLDFAVSISVLSPSQEEAIAAEAQFLALLPFSEDGLLTRVSQDLVIRLTAVYIRMILDALYDDPSIFRAGSFGQLPLNTPQRVGALLLQSRYRNIPLPTAAAGVECEDLYPSGMSRPKTMPGLIHADERLYERMFEHAMEVAKAFAKLPDGVLEICLADVLEELAIYAVHVEWVKAFFRVCF